MPLSPALIDHVVSAACLAPSVHNTQPWRFVQRGTDVLDLFADRSRQLTYLDPTGRQLHLSCGAALTHAQVAARALGLTPHSRLLPGAGIPDLLATLTLHEGPPPSEEETALAGAMLERHTYRGRFADTPILPAVLDVLAAVAQLQGAALRQVTGDDLIELEVLLARADLAQQRDPAYLAELASWADGIPTGATDPSLGRGSSLRTRDFRPGRPAADDPPVADHPAVVGIVTDADHPRDWLVAGQALGAVLLHGVEYGVQAQPLGQLTDAEGNRSRLRALMDTVGTPQLMLRLGYPLTVQERAPRRPVGQVLVPTGE